MAQLSGSKPARILDVDLSGMGFAVAGSFVNSRIQVNHRRLELVWVALNVLLLSISHGELGVGTSGAAPGLTACMSSVLTLQRLFATMPLMDRGES